jgi:tricorn protease-like protein
MKESSVLRRERKMEANNEKKHRRMRRKLIGAVGIFLLCLCASFSLKSVDSQAAVKVATSSNGKYMYYSVQGTIYRIDTNTGKTKKIVKIKNTNWITNISYYKGYLYFTADYYYYMEGTDGTKPYVCRVKTNGKGFKKLAKGTTPVVYNGKIYYESMTFTKNSYDVSDAKTQGFQRMNLDGSKKKRLISGNSYYGSMTVVNNRIYYITGNTRCDQLYSANLDGTDQKYITSGREFDS